jgi:hypothetical protein
VDQYLLSSCDAKAYPSFYLRIDKYWFEISPSTYIINATYHKDGADQYKDYCTLALTKLSQNFIILGTAFMKNYYMIFDLEQDRVGVSNLNTLTQVFEGNPPTKRETTDAPIKEATGNN